MARGRCLFTLLFVLALPAVSCNSREEQPPPPAAVPPDPLASVLKNKEGLLDLPFAEVVRAATGHEILPLDPAVSSSPDADILAALEDALHSVIDRLNAPDGPTRGLRRINEASRFVEDMLIEILDSRPGFSCGIPPTAGGAEQRSGYPDLKLVHEASGRVAYLDPKIFEKDGEDSTLRTFYYEPKTRTNKILDNAHHLLAGIAHDGNDGAWRFLGWHLVDLSGFRVRLKAEFQGSNRDLYRPRLIISSGGM